MPPDLRTTPGVSADETHRVTLRRMVVGPLATNCWAVHAVGSPGALLVDPGDDPEKILDTIRDLRITAIVLTHAHFDHLMAVTDVADATGAPVLTHPDDAPVWPHELESLSRVGRFDASIATAELLSAGQDLRPDPRRSLWDGIPDAVVRDGQVVQVGPLAV